MLSACSSTETCLQQATRSAGRNCPRWLTLQAHTLQLTKLRWRLHLCVCWPSAVQTCCHVRQHDRCQPGLIDPSSAVHDLASLPACSGAERVESWIKELSSSADLKPDASGSDIQKMLAGIANRAQEKKFSYNKFFAIGLFRMLELTGGQPDGAQAHSVPSCDLDLLHRGGL